ncbi:hypothetical protein LEN26_006757 [Aphanomyces euteiches]|nr:hypothetical protein AeMF1_011056 [Aphanomyces euteiches]KAH9134551.1 hypothetical protein LEN26_006757 [Aphanomyces euteiches]KAH9190102.1 hypothetical protein AeNC1_007917 [Aphanomyces euteiches]
MTCRSLVALAVAGLLGCSFADTLLTTKCPIYTNDTNTTSVTPASYCVVNETTATMVFVTTDMLNLSHRNINVVSTIPTLAAIVDLSFNEIRDISALPSDQTSSVLNVNLSHNALTASSYLELPSTIQTLDLSYNRITSMDESFWRNLPRSLQSLSLKTNGLKTVRCSSMPPKLRQLDLSGNAIQTIVADVASFNLLTRPDFVLVIDPNQTVVSTDPAACLKPPSYIHDNFICVTEATSSTASQSAFVGFMGKYAAGFFIVLVVVYAARETIRAQRNRLGDLQERSTYISSIYIKSPTTQSTDYVPAPTARAEPSRHPIHV